VLHLPLAPLAGCGLLAVAAARAWREHGMSVVAATRDAD
jgi:hypothetical protein